MIPGNQWQFILLSLGSVNVWFIPLELKLHTYAIFKQEISQSNNPYMRI